jgi:hypothetical protein
MYQGRRIIHEQHRRPYEATSDYSLAQRRSDRWKHCCASWCTTLTAPRRRPADHVQHREAGPEHFTLSSDAGEPLFPDSVEAMRLVRAYMEAFGLSQDELYTMCTKNPAKVVGLELN